MTLKIAADIALILTFFALLWYAWETSRMKKELIRQNEISIRPCIVIFYEDNEGSYFFNNVGNGPAFHVKLEEIPLLEDTAFRFTYKSDSSDLIVPNNKSRIIFRDENGNIASSFHLGAISPRSASKSFDVVVNYISMDNIKYQTYGKIGKIGSKFIKTIKVK